MLLAVASTTMHMQYRYRKDTSSSDTSGMRHLHTEQPQHTSTAAYLAGTLSSRTHIDRVAGVPRSSLDVSTYSIPGTCTPAGNKVRWRAVFFRVCVCVVWVGGWGGRGPHEVWQVLGRLRSLRRRIPGP